MIKSMTGFGRGEHAGQYKQVTVEIKSVNHRYSEILVKLPRQYNLLEENIKRYVFNSISRGRVELYCKVEDAKKEARQVQIDKELALAYYKALKELAVITEAVADIGITQIAQLPDVLKIEDPQENLDDVWGDFLPALEQAVSLFLEMREKEGAKLKDDLEEHLGVIGALREKIAEKSPQVVTVYREKLQGRLKEIMDNNQVDENRLAMEIALFADRCSIDEELVRLKSHLGQFRLALQEMTPVGRKLDFLLQEMNREINTIGSKANDLGITQHVVEMKSELEKLREQVQNIE